MNSCSGCWDTDVNLFACKGGHGFCKECLATGLSIKVVETGEYGCIHGSCNENYSERTIKTVLQPHLVERYYIDLVVKSVQNLEIQNIHKCPFCENRVILDDDITELGTFYCMDGCRRYSCMRCNRAYHDGPCEIPAHHQRDELATKNFVIVCCGVPFFRGDACNKVKCPKCKTPYCWICKEKNITYIHFGNTKPCQLYGERREPIAERREPIAEQPRQPVRRVQCSGITSRNRRCSRITMSASGRCHSHNE